jgi:hypothetical protein
MKFVWYIGVPHDEELVEKLRRDVKQLMWIIFFYQLLGLRADLQETKVIYKWFSPT